MMLGFTFGVILGVTVTMIAWVTQPPMARELTHKDRVCEHLISKLSDSEKLGLGLDVYVIGGMNTKDCPGWNDERKWTVAQCQEYFKEKYGE